ncbi:MAG: zinc-dependent metalloprotease, partial [Phycisphaerae bacterium]
PRVRFADPAKRPGVIERLRQEAAAKEQMKADGRLGVTGFGGIAMPTAADLARDPVKFEERLNLAARMCTLATGKGLDLAMLRMHMDIIGLELDGGTGEIENTRGDSVSVLDGVPEWFIGPLLVDLVAHEVGHTLGLRHNFKGSSIYTLAQVNSPDVKGKKSFSGSVMDYVPVNINVPDAKKLEEYLKQQKTDDTKDSKKDEGKADEKKADDKKPATKSGSSPLGPEKPQELGDYAQVDNGPYDYWAIEYGYPLDDPKKVLERVNDPELVYATDWDLSGPDPLVRQYDFTSNPADYANNLMELARYHRSRLLDRFVKDGDSWARARRGYSMTMIMQARGANIMAKLIGGADLSYSKKGDPNGRDPIIPTSGEKQREAVKWITDNIFQDNAWGLTPEMLTKFTTDRWGDQGGMSELMQDPSFPVHDRVAALQIAALVQIMNPTTIRRVYDNELRVPATTDTLTIPELLDSVTKGIWSEIDKAPGQQFTARQPMISSLRRNLQREHLELLSFLTNSGVLLGEASKPITNLSLAQLRSIQDKIKGIVESTSAAGRLDP